MSDAFADGMFDSQMEISKAAIAEVQRLRQANRALKELINQHAPDMWAMREQITMLEMQLRDARVGSQGAKGGE